MPTRLCPSTFAVFSLRWATCHYSCLACAAYFLSQFETSLMFLIIFKLQKPQAERTDLISIGQIRMLNGLQCRTPCLGPQSSILCLGLQCKTQCLALQCRTQCLGLQCRTLCLGLQCRTLFRTAVQDTVFGTAVQDTV